MIKKSRALRKGSSVLPPLEAEKLFFSISQAEASGQLSALLGPEIVQEHKVSVIIPVLNESRTVASVVKFALRNPKVGEVLVVDDGSIDGTPELATGAGARVITSTMLGKGASMEDGLREAQFEVVLYLDGDLRGLKAGLIGQMVDPIFRGEADFVKAKFARRAGRVTVLTARPLIRTYFPELADFDQPLSGIMAARRSLLGQLRFENDYGVDVGLLIDAAALNAGLLEVDIGRIEHDSHPLENLGEMATQVARAILHRAARAGRLRPSFIQEVQEVERHRRAQVPHVFNRFPKLERLALFDMDGVLLNGRFITALATRTNRMDQLEQYLDNFKLTPEVRAQRIARIFKGIPRGVFEETALEIPLMHGAIETIVGLRKAGYSVGIVTDSYQTAAEIVRRRVFADFAFGNLMRFTHGKASGRVTLSPAMFYPDGCCEHKQCKVNVMYHLREKLGVTSDRVLAVGDGENDICMLKEAGCSVAFHPKSAKVTAAGQHRLDKSLSDILDLVRNRQPAVTDLCRPECVPGQN